MTTSYITHSNSATRKSGRAHRRGEAHRASRPSAHALPAARKRPDALEPALGKPDRAGQEVNRDDRQETVPSEQELKEQWMEYEGGCEGGAA